jgi:hypothetical protein
MPTYRLEVLEPPDERLRHRREFEAPDDAEAVEYANKRYRQFAKGVLLDRYVLYEGDRVVHEHVDKKKNR